MAKSPANVQKFEEDLTKLIIEKGKEEREEMIKFKKDLTGDQNATLNHWDGSFYGNLFLQKNYKIETEKIREYFPMENVVTQTLDIYQELLVESTFKNNTLQTRMDYGLQQQPSQACCFGRVLL